MSYKNRDRARELIEKRLTQKQKKKLKRNAKIAGHIGVVAGGSVAGAEAGERIGGAVGRVAGVKLIRHLARKRGGGSSGGVMLAVGAERVGRHVGRSVGSAAGAELGHVAAKRALYSKRGRAKFEKKWGKRLFGKKHGPESIAIRSAGVGAGALSGMFIAGKAAQRYSKVASGPSHHSFVGKAALGGAAVGAFAGLLTATAANRRIWKDKKTHPRNKQSVREAVDELLFELEGR